MSTKSVSTGSNKGVKSTKGAAPRRATRTKALQTATTPAGATGTPAGGAPSSGGAATTPATPTTSAGGLAPFPPGEIVACAGYVQSAIALIPASDPLSALDKRHSAKPRPGLDVILPQLASLASQYGLNSQLVSTDALQSQASEISELADLSSKIVLLEKAIDDRRFQLSSTLWTGVTSMYSMFKRLSKDNPQLAAQLVPVAQYFTRRNAAVKANHPKSARGKAALAAKQAAVKGASSSSSSANGQAVPSAIPAMVPSVTLANGASATRTTQ